MRPKWIHIVQTTACAVGFALFQEGGRVCEFKYPSHGQIRSYIERVCEPVNLDPEFVYTLAQAESSLDPHAKTHSARGLMQLTYSAWATVSKQSFHRAWDWRANIEVAVGYLCHCRDFLQKNEAFSYPNLAAAYHYGPSALARREFDLSQFPPHKNHIYRRLLSCATPPMLYPKAESIKDAQNSNDSAPSG